MNKEYIKLSFGYIRRGNLVGVVKGWAEKDRIFLDTGQELRASLDDKDFESLEKSLEDDDETDKSFKDGRREVLEEVKKKFGGGVIIGVGDDGPVVATKPELDKWLEEELDKLSSKDNARNKV